MADLKISQLTGATTPLAGTEVVPLVQSGATTKVTVANLTAGRAVSAASLALTTSPLPETSGGTGQSSYAVGDLVYANTTTTLAKLADVATGNALISGGVGVAPSYGKIGLTTHVSGTLPVANGGTGITTLTANRIPYGNGTSAFQSSANLTFDGSTATLAGQTSITTGVFNNVGSAQNIAIASGQAGFIVITGVQGGVGASSWNVPFVNRSGTTAVSASPTKAFVTADPISSVTASSANIVITPLAANTYISYAIYYTPCAA